MFMEGSLHLALSSMKEEEKTLIGKQMPLPNANLAEGEAKIRQSIAINANYIHSYLILATILIKGKKFAEAKEVIQKGLTLEPITEFDRELLAELKGLQNGINTPASK